MTTQYGYALLHRGRIVAIGDEGRIAYCIYTLKKEADEAQKQYQHCTVVRVRIDAVKK